jgi:hypothetical protein
MLGDIKSLLHKTGVKVFGKQGWFSMGEGYSETLGL